MATARWIETSSRRWSAADGAPPRLEIDSAPAQNLRGGWCALRYVWSMRAVYFVIGWICVGLGLLGAALPLLPTVPFLLLAAVCFARSSPAVHDWLVEHPRLGPPIRDWRRDGAISRPAKRLAMLSILASFAIPLALGAPGWVLAIQLVALACVSVFILTRPDGGGAD